MPQPIRILLVEDSPDDADIVLRELTRGGFVPDALRVADAQGLRDALAASPWDAILIDFVIPGFGGLQALELVRDSGVDAPVVLVSGKVGEETAVEIMRAGARDYVMKEDLSRLAPVVRRELDAARARREAKKAQEALRKKDALLGETVDRAPIILFSVDARGVMTVCRGNGIAAIGLRQEDVVNRSIFEVFSDIPEETAKLQRALLGETVRTIARLRGRAFDTVATPVRDANGAVVGVNGIAVDVTERVAAETELAETQRMFQRAQEVARIGSWFSDPSQEGRLRWSDEVYEIFGIPRAAFDGRVETFFRLIHPKDADRVRAASTAALESGTPYDVEHRIVRPDGQVRWVHEKGEVIRDIAGKPMQMIGVAQDVTDRKIAERRLAMETAVANVLAEAPTLDASRPGVIAAICGILGWTAGAVWLPDAEARVLRCASFWMSPGTKAGTFEKATRDAAFPRGIGLPGRVWRTGQAEWIPDVAANDSFPRAVPAAESGLRLAVAFPVIVGGEVEAVYEFYGDDAEQADAGLLQTFGAIAKSISLYVERRTAVDRLADSGRYAHTILDSSLDVITILDAKGDILSHNAAVRTVLGYDPAEMIGTNAFSYVHPDDLALVRENFRKGFEDPSLAPVTLFRFRKKDGTWIWFESIGRNLLGDPSIKGILINSRNVTARVQAEKERGNLAERLTALLQSAGEGIVGVDGEDRCIFLNEAAARMYGYAPEELIGKRMHEIVHHSTKDGVKQDRDACHIKAAYESGTSVRRDDEAFWRKDGSWFPVEYSASAVRENGVVTGAVVTFTDISGRLETERRIKELDALKNKFIQIVSHQFRTPLNVMRWNLESLLAEELGKLEPAQREFVRITYDADLEVIKRIGDLLTAIDIEEGRLTVAKEEISLESLWGSVMAEWKKACAVKEVACTYAGPPEPLPPVMADADKIRDVLAKFADNALTYTPKGGAIEVTLRRTDGRVRFAIRDTGIGIPPAEQSRVWTRFFRATNAPTMKPDASGLGLFIAKHFVEQHGGTVGLESTESKGSTFWFELPIK